MNKINLIFSPSLLLAIIGFIVAATTDKDIGIKLIFSGFILFNITALFLVWFPKINIFQSKSIWGVRISVTGFAIMGLPMVFSFWMQQEPIDNLSKLGIAIFVLGIIVSIVEQRNAKEKNH